MNPRKLIAALGCGIALLTATSVGAAEPGTYPDRPLRVVVPFSAGGGNDIVARMLAKHLDTGLKTPVVVENRPGAGGNIGMSSVARSEPDGYTLAYVANTVVINPYLYRSVGFDIQQDFEPVARLATSPIWVLANPELPVSSLAELIEYGKTHPGRLSYATPGVGTPHHMAAELLKARSGLDMVHVPYKGASGAATDVVGGQVPVLIATPASVQAFVAGGKLRPIASMDAARGPAYPELPTVTETVPGFEATIWHGVMAPAQTPPAVVDALSQAIRRALEETTLPDELKAVGFAPAYETPADMAGRIERELALWADVARQAGIEPE